MLISTKWIILLILTSLNFEFSYEADNNLASIGFLIHENRSFNPLLFRLIEVGK